MLLLLCTGEGEWPVIGALHLQYYLPSPLWEKRGLHARNLAFHYLEIQDKHAQRRAL